MSTPAWLSLGASSGLITMSTPDSSLAMTTDLVTVSVTLNDHSSITASDSFDVKIGYSCAGSTLTAPSTPFTDNTYTVSGAT